MMGVFSQMFVGEAGRVRNHGGLSIIDGQAKTPNLGRAMLFVNRSTPSPPLFFPGIGSIERNLLAL
jgi:hypothetical protein